MMRTWLDRQLKKFGMTPPSLLRQPTGGAPSTSTTLGTSTTPATPASHSHARQIRLGSELVSYQLRRSRRRSIGFLINAEGLHVTAPSHASITHIEQALQEKQRWILTKLQEVLAHVAPPKVVWADGVQFPFLGQNLTLQIRADAPRNALFDAAAGTLTVRPLADASKHGDQIRRWMQARAEGLFAQRLELYAQQLGVTYSSFGLSSARTRWGSCSSQGKIRLNWRLMHFDLRLIDYVIAHELAHLREMNHSPRFWREVGSIFPDYANARAELKQQAAALRGFF